MKALNSDYDKFCEPKCKSYSKITKYITIIDEFFENFDQAKNFFTSREKWLCTKYQGNSKPGYESLFPHWIGKSLMEKYIIDNKISEDVNSYNIICNFFYDDPDGIATSISQSCLYPHVDDICEDENILSYICLINLNNTSIATRFYTFNDEEFCTKKMHPEWEDYSLGLQKNMFEYFDRNPTKNKVKDYLNQVKDLKINFIREVNYFPNQAIIYPGNLFHSPHVPSEFTEDNLRSVLRICFVAKKHKVDYFNYK